MHGQVQKAYEEEDKERDQERRRAGDESKAIQIKLGHYQIVNLLLAIMRGEP